MKGKLWGIGMYRAVIFASLLIQYSLHGLEPSPAEMFMAQKSISHTGQKRTEMIYSETLNFIARKKAEDMAARGYFSHIDPDGYGLNFAVHQAGYRLPNSGAPSANSIESIGVRHQNGLTAEAAANIVFPAWMESPGHRTHILGEQPGFANQIRYAVGYAFTPQGPFGFNSHYFVFVSAPDPPESIGTTLSPYAEWLFENLTLPQMDHPDGDPDDDGIPNVVEFLVDGDPLIPGLFPKLSISKSEDGTHISFHFPVRSVPDPRIRINVIQSDRIKSLIRIVGEYDFETGFTMKLPQSPAGFFQLMIER